MSRRLFAKALLVHLLRVQALCRPRHMLVCEGSHEVVAVVVVGVEAKVDALVVAGLLRSLEQVLGQKLALQVKAVAGALRRREQPTPDQHDATRLRTTSMSISSGPFHCLTSSVASCCFHFSC